VTKLSVEQVVDAVRGVLPHGVAQAALHEPHFGGNEWTYVKQCIDTGWVSSVGAFVDRFERDVAAYTGAARAIATVNGTAALHLSLVLLGVRAGDEVLMPSLTFVGTANAVAHQQAVPHFCDIDAGNLGLDAEKLEKWLSEIAELRDGKCVNRRSGRRIGAVIAVHIFGHPADVERLAQICDHYGLPLIEDAAESLGAFRAGRHTGTTGRIGILSFNGNKIITTGGGGMLITNDVALADRAKHLSTTAKLPHKWAFDHDQVGYNYRLPNLNAALGCAQLEQLGGFLAQKRKLAERYAAALSGIAGVRFMREPASCQSNYWLCSLMLEPSVESDRDALLAALHAVGIAARPAWRSMHELPMYSSAPRMDLSVAEACARRLVSLPSGVALCPAQ
jgi:perosamine synthetase